MLKSSYRGSGFALIIEGDEVTVAQESDAGMTQPVPHPRRVGDRADNLDADTLADLLATGEIVSTSTDDNGRTIVEISGAGHTVTAVFARSPRKKDLDPEIAAYRLDRLLEADIVPVTVSREIERNKRGTLQFLPARARDEAYRAGAGQGSGAWCPLQRQWMSMYVFDVLTYNIGRSPGTMVYNTGNWQLMSMGHDRAFGNKVGRPSYLDQLAVELTSSWIAALNEMTDEKLTEALSDVLSKRQISAIGKRRDLLLESAK